MPTERTVSHRNPEGVPPEHRNPSQTGVASSGEFFTVLRRRFTTSASAWSGWRSQALKDFRFCDLGQQWNPQDKQRRAATKRPCLTIDQIRQFKKQIVNAQRQARPGMQVHPVGDIADPDTAQVYEGILRLIQKPLNYPPADTWYDLAFDHMVTAGLGVLRWFTEYIPNTFQQRIRIFGVENPLAVYLDPAFREPDASDMLYCFITEDFSKDEFKARWPNSLMATGSYYKSLGDDEPNWMPGGSVRVAEYFYVEIEPVELALISDDTSATRSRVVAADTLPKNAAVLDRRIEERRVVRWARVNGIEILEGNEAKTEGQIVIGNEIPVIPVFGDMLQVEGKRHLAGMVRYMRDPQRMYNFLASALVEAVALAPKAPWVAEATTIEAFKDIWQRANIDNLSVLPYNATAGPDGQPLPRPERNVAEPPIQAMVQGLTVMLTALQATANMYEPSLGKNKGDQSGKAIALLQKQGDQGTSNWSDNLTRALTCLGRQLVKAIPQVYDVPQVLHILRADDRKSRIAVHASQPPSANLQAGHPPVAPNQADDQLAPSFQGVEKIYDLDNGEYAVEVTVGNSAVTRRQEFVGVAAELYKNDPAFMQATLDIFLSHLDTPGFTAMAERAKLMLPPQIQQAINSGQIDVNALQGKLQQSGQMIDMLSKELHAKTDIINTEQIKRDGDLKKAQLEADTKIKIAEMNNIAGIAEAEIKQGLTDAQAQIRILESQLMHIQEAATQGREHAHELRVNEQEHAHAMAQGQQQADIAAQQSAQDHAETLGEGAQAHDQNMEAQAAAPEASTE